MSVSVKPGKGMDDELRGLFTEYTDMLLAADPDFRGYLDIQNYEHELSDPEGKYCAIFVAESDGTAVGCVALRNIDSENCELKRLYVRPEYRRSGIASGLMSAVISEAKRQGFRFMLLDTFPFLEDAVRMYRTLGFYEISSYNGTPMDDLIYMRLDLDPEAAKAYSAVLFDLDGTLTDSGPGIVNSVCYALDKLVYPYERSELFSFVGPPLYDSFEKYCNISHEKAVECVAVYREYYSDRGIFECEVYPGIRELLQKLHGAGIRTMVATSKPEEFARKITDHFGLTEYFDIVAGATMDGSRVEKSDVIRWCLSGCGVSDVSDIVMIGDRKFDVIGARELGMDSVGVLYGYGDRKELQEAGATYIAPTVEDIEKILLRRQNH